MKIRLTTGNIHKLFSEYSYNNQPIGWLSIQGSDSYENKQWTVTGSSVLQSADAIEGSTGDLVINLPAKKHDFYTYCNLIKSITAKGAGSIYNEVPAQQPGILTGTFQKFDRTFFTDDGENLDREYEEDAPGDTVTISNIETILQMETRLLRFPEYEDQRSFKPLIVQEKNGKKLEKSRQYTPFSTQLQFFNCTNEINALNTFFLCCQYYEKPFTVEIYSEETQGWGVQAWGTQWGGITSGGYTSKYEFTIKSVKYNANGATSSLNVDVTFQRENKKYAVMD